MSEAMNETPPPLPPPGRPPSLASKERAWPRFVAVAALVVALAAGALAWDGAERVRELDSLSATRLAELGAEAARARQALALAQDALKDSQSRLAELESRAAETQESRAALEEMYRELSRNADDRLLSEVEQMLVLASQQLQLAGNVRGALAALQAADQRLGRAEKLSAAPLRRSLAQDMDRLKALPQVDTVGLAVKLDNLVAQADSLPLAIVDTAPTRVAMRARNLEDAGFTRVARDFWDEMKSLVRIRELETTDAALLTPSHAYFLRENLRLRLLSARVALLARDEQSFRDDARAAQAWITRYFDPKARQNVVALASLKQIAETPVSIAVPDLNASLAAVRTARAARDRAR